METGKYGPLADYLGDRRRADKGALALSLSFEQIEKIIECKLPASARQSASFWGNDLTHAQARAWIAEGWASRDVSVAEQRVTFASDPKATKKAEELSALQLETLIYGSRRAAQDQLRRLKTQLKANPLERTPDERQLSQMTEALAPLGCILDTQIHPPPARGHRTRPGAGSLTASCARDGRSRICMTFVGGRIEVYATLGDDLGGAVRWPPDRAREAWLLIPLWEGDNPWLVASTDFAADRDSPVTLRASLSLVATPSDAECRRVFCWLVHETDAFEDGLRKMLCRKTPVTAHRAMELARRKLARHVRPPESLATSHAISSTDAQRPWEQH